MTRRGIAPLLGGLLALGLLGSAEASRSWSYSYHPDTTSAEGYTVPGQLATADGPRTDVSDVTSYAYDAQGNLTQITNALGQVSQITAHDASGRPLTLIDPNGVTTQLAYDARGRLTSRTTAGATTRFGYDAVGNLTTLTLPTGSTLTYRYDAARRLTAIEDSAGNRIAYTLDAAGNRVEARIVDASGQLRFTRAQLFDELSRLRQVIGLDGTHSLSYDANGNLTQAIDGEANATAHAFDGLNRLTASTDALAGQTQYQYDSQHRLTAVTDPNGHTTSYGYNGLGDLLTLTSPDTGTTSYTYDAAGNRLSQTDARGQITQYRYDALNRLTAIIDPSDPSQTVAFDYDDPSASFGIGRLTRISGPGSAIAYQYTAHGQLASVTHRIDGRSYTIGYGYDSAGTLTSLSSPSGAFIHYQRDAQGRVVSISGSDGTSSQTLVSNLQYAPFGPLTSLTYGNGLTLTRTLDSQYRLTGIATGQAFGRQYTFNGNDDISAIRHSDGRQTSFQYDALRRLIQADLGVDLLGYSYDANGNRLSRTSQQGSTHYTLASDSNRLLGRSGLTNDTASYDANGNLIARGSLTFAYDRYNRLTEVYDQGTLIARYRYNALHQRIAKTVNGETTHFLYDQAGHLLAEFDAASGLPRVEYVWLDDLPIAMLRTATDSPGVYFIHSDHLNTPQWVSNAWGSAVWAAEYSPFGQAAVTNATLSFNLRFPGQYFDAETGLHYNWHRYYDPSTGRYITSDPIGLAGGLNTYAYVGGNPLIRQDPAGLSDAIFGFAPIFVPGSIDQSVALTDAQTRGAAMGGALGAGALFGGAAVGGSTTVATIGIGSLGQGWAYLIDRNAQCKPVELQDLLVNMGIGAIEGAFASRAPAAAMAETRLALLMTPAGYQHAKNQLLSDVPNPSGSFAGCTCDARSE